VIIHCCADAEATKKVAASIAPLLQPGDVILLDGDLGAGKTTFTQGLAEALGVDEAVTSPTFTLVRTYETTAGFPLCHLDVYRLERLWEIVDLAIPEMLDDGAVAVVEWGKKAQAALPGDHLDITLEVAGGEGERTLTLEPVGLSWRARIEGL
jgi:tRNA threonylcarbamoyladenosine biosynthesis protein TsaE